MKDINILIICVSIVAILNRLGEFVWTVKVWNRFYLGLRERVFDKPEDSKYFIERVPILNA
jgi:hypothetical protein